MNEKHYKLRFLPLFEEDLNEIVDTSFESRAAERNATSG